MAVSTRLATEPLNPASELADFLKRRDDDGAVVTFTGLTRGERGSVCTLRLDWYPGMTEGSLRTIAEEVSRLFEVSDVLVVHRGGDLRPGEPIVLVAVAARHRREAFLCADQLMDRLKTEAAFWKHESGPDGGRWIEPSDRDVRDRARWN